MAAVNVTCVAPTAGQNEQLPFNSPFSFSIEYECLYALQHDLEWKMTYVGSADSETHDQVLDSVLVGPVLQGSYKFVFEGNPPNPSLIPVDDLVGVTAIFLTCSYQEKEFIRVGYFVNVGYADEALNENPPEVPDFSQLSRTILIDHPRVTRFAVDFDNATGASGVEESTMEIMQEGEGLEGEGFPKQIQDQGGDDVHMF